MTAAKHLALPPVHPLRPYVQGIWRVSAQAGHRERIMPRGTVDLLFPLDGAVVPESDATTPLTQGPYLVGVRQRVVNTITAGRTTLLGVSLSGERVRGLLRVPAHDISGAIVAGTEVLDDAMEIFARLYDARSFQAQCRIILEWLRRRLLTSARMADMAQACRMLAQTPTENQLCALTTTLGVSSRQVRRLFLDHVGLTPQQYIRLRRFNTALRLMASPHSLTTIAHDAHYFDQAHLCHDFQAIAGMTPGEYRELRGPVPGLVFSEDVRLIQVVPTRLL